MANKPIKSIKYPGLSDTYTFVQIGTEAGQAADSKVVEDKIDLLNTQYVVETGANLVDARTIDVGYITSTGEFNTNAAYRHGVIRNLPAGTYTFASYNVLGIAVSRAKRVYIVSTGTYVDGNNVGTLTFTLNSTSDVLVGYTTGLYPVVVSGSEIAFSRMKYETLKSPVQIKSNAITVQNYIDNTATRETGFIQSDGTIATNGTYANYETTGFNYIPAGTYTIKNFATYSTCKVLIYDSEQNVSIGTLTDISQSGTTITTVYDGYIRATTYSGGNLVMTTGTPPTEYSEQYDCQFELEGVYIPSTPSPQPTPSDGFVIASKNLANPDESENALLNSSGVPSANADYVLSGYIPVENGKSYIVCAYTNTYDSSPRNTTHGYALYDANKAFISGTYSQSSAKGKTVTINNANAKYIRGYGRTAGGSAFMVAEGSNPLVKYEPYYNAVEQVSDAVAKMNPLWGKNYFAAGDSWTEWSDATYSEGRYKDTYITYDREIRLRNNMGGENDGISGSILAISKEYQTGTQSSQDYLSPFVYQRYLQIPENTDYCTIAFGINDESHTNLGTINDNDNTTFYGAWNVLFNWIITNRPSMKTLIIIWDRIGNMSTSGYREAIIDVCKKWGFPYFDPFNDDKVIPFMYGKSASIGLDESVKTARANYFHAVGNDSHPGQVMHRYESTIIEDILRRL